MTYLVIAITLIGISVWFGLSYRTLVQLRSSIEAAGTKLAAELKHRHEVVQKLSDFVTGELKAEPELAQKLLDARAQAVGAANDRLKAREEVENDLGDRTGLLLSALEKDTAASNNSPYAQLRDEVLDAEDAVTLAREDYNDLVVRFNAGQTMLPASLFAAKAGLKVLEEFQIENFFTRHPLKIKGTLPTPGKSAFPRISRRPQSDTESSPEESTTRK